MYNLEADLRGRQATAHLAYNGKVFVRGGLKYYAGAVSSGIYADGAKAHIARFHRRVTEGRFDSSMAHRSVDGHLTAIFGREAMLRKAWLTTDEVIKNAKSIWASKCQAKESRMKFYKIGSRTILAAGVVVCCATMFSVAGEPAAGQLHVGWATVDITPSARVVLDGSGYKRVTTKIHVFGQCAAAGDQCPDVIVRAKAEKVMTARRKISWKQELANRVLRAVDDVWPTAQAAVQTQLVFAHRTMKRDIPNKNSYNEARWMPSMVPIEFHVLRLGDVAVATNPFELFLDYGIQIKGRSKAVLTFISQLTCDCQGYLPTRRAVAGGDYSAVNHSVGPTGGRVLVDESVKAINSLWP